VRAGELCADLKSGGFVLAPAETTKKAGTPSAIHLSRPRDLGVAMRRQLAWSNAPHLLIVIEPNLQCDFSPCGGSINAHAKGIFGKIETLQSRSVSTWHCSPQHFPPFGIVAHP